MIELVAFLGNHGREYAKNRHNAAWMLAEKEPYASLNWQKKFKGQYAARNGIHFIMPETYMNLSGTSVQEAAAFYKLSPDNILVVHDELELPLGVASFKFSGGLGGHNGLRSMKDRFATADFWRFRIGIGRPNHSDIAGWVLSDFTQDEAITLSLVLDASATALQEALLQGPESLLPEWNKKRIVECLKP